MVHTNQGGGNKVKFSSLVYQSSPVIRYNLAMVQDMHSFIRNPLCMCLQCACTFSGVKQGRINSVICMKFTTV